MLYIIIIIYSVWTALMIIKQFDKSIFKVSKYDVFALIPNWTLFAPNPKFSDYKILYRDKFSNGTISDITELDWICNKKINFLWKGQMREQKFLSLICKDVFRYRKNNKDSMFFFDYKTVMLRDYIKNYKLQGDTVVRQLIVVETYGHLISREEIILFVTDIKY